MSLYVTDNNNKTDEVQSAYNRAEFIINEIGSLVDELAKIIPHDGLKSADRIGQYSAMLSHAMNEWKVDQKQ